MNPYSRPELIEAAADAERAVHAFFSSLSQDEFATRVDGAWTPAEHVVHLCVAVNAVARGLSMKRWVLRLRFGASGRLSRDFTQLRDDYRACLATGLGATGRFVPQQETIASDTGAARQAEILARWSRANTRLRSALEGWSERDLDRLQMPHPILGKITAREMMYFTIYHGHHHVAAAERRIARFA